MTEYETEALTKLQQSVEHLEKISLFIQSFFVLFGIILAMFIAVWFVRTYVIGLVRTYFRFRL